MQSEAWDILASLECLERMEKERKERERKERERKEDEEDGWFEVGDRDRLINSIKAFPSPSFFLL